MAPRRSLSVPPALRVVSELAWRSAVVAAAALAIGWLALYLRVVTVPAFAALLAATVLEPVVSFLRRRGWPSILATWTVLVGAVAVLVGVVTLVVPPFVDQIGELGPQVDEAIADIEDWLATGPLGIESPDLSGRLEELRDRTVDSASGNIVDSVTLVGEVLAALLLVPVMLFFFLKDGPRLVDWAVGHVPAPNRATVRRGGRAAWHALGSYVRGTLVVGTVDGAIIGVGLAVLGVPLALPLGVITAAAAFFPLVGAVVAGALASLVALVSGGIVDALLVVGLTVVVQQVEGDVLAPVVLGRALRLHPLAVLGALTVGAIVAGVLGALVAVPLVAVATAVAAAIRDRDRSDGVAGV